MRKPVQRKYAAETAHGSRGEQVENLPCSIADPCITHDKIRTKNAKCGYSECPRDGNL